MKIAILPVLAGAVFGIIAPLLYILAIRVIWDFVQVVLHVILQEL